MAFHLLSMALRSRNHARVQEIVYRHWLLPRRNRKNNRMYYLAAGDIVLWEVELVALAVQLRALRLEMGRRKREGSWVGC
jgi:hypothetical protein